MKVLKLYFPFTKKPPAQLPLPRITYIPRCSSFFETDLHLGDRPIFQLGIFLLDVIRPMLTLT